MDTQKKHPFRKGIALTLALVLAVGTFFMLPTKAADTSALGALVDSFAANNSTFTLSEKSRLFLTAEPTGELLQTVQLVQRQFAADSLPSASPLDIVWGDRSMVRNGDILILLDPSSGIGAEGYQLNVTKYATVTASDVNGLLYGLNMLHKHFRNAKATTINGFTAADTPDTPQRAVSLDCGRKYLTKDWICNYIREMSWMGYNTIELHFSDDSGFRIDIWGDEAYHKDVNGDGVAYDPKNDFSWLPGSQVTSWTHNGSSGLTGINFRKDPDRGKYLTTAELVEIIEVAKEYHMDVIPAFDCPAHLDYVTWKYEQNYLANKSYSFVSTYTGTDTTYNAAAVGGCINYTGYKHGALYTDTTGVSQTMTWPYFTCVNINDAHAKAFLFELYIDIANFFKEYAGSSDFSIGADEVNLNESDNGSYTYKWGFNDFVCFINDLNDLLNSKGYTIRMYNDFMASTHYTNTSGETFASNIEILYWDSPLNPNSATSNNNHTQPVSYHVAQNRILYNCINTNTYYVLRINENQGDARSVSCAQWTFNHSDEISIYNEWYPADISEHGIAKSEDVDDVPDKLLGGGYFLVWNDYAALNTEVEMWNGVTDFALKTGEFYSLRDRMWSNIIKQWNKDINTSLTYANFKLLRDTLGDFPGLGDGTAACSAVTTLPAATAPIRLADRSELAEALTTKLEQGDYSGESYAAYLAAYDAAAEVNDNNRATDKEIGTALQNLAAAIKALTIETHTITVHSKTNLGNTVADISTQTYAVPANDSSYEIFIPALSGYVYQKTEGAAMVLSTSGDGSGYLRGSATSDLTITIWYKNTVDTSRLNTLVNEAIPEQGSYTADSWAAYRTALNRAKNFSLSVTTQQSDVDTAVRNLEAATTALVTNCDTTTISVEKMSEAFPEGLQVGLHLSTTPNIPSLTVTNKDTGETETLTACFGKVQTLNSGKIVKYWSIFFPADETGTFTYIISYGTASVEVTVTVF